MAKTALSDAALRSFQPPSRGQVCHWDKTLAGFGCRVSQGGSKTFVLNHKNTLITIGRFPTISLSEARTEAKRLLAEFTLGKVRPQSVTYKVAVSMFLEEKTKQRKASTVEAYEGLLNRLAFSGQLAEITGDEVRRKLSHRSNYNHYLVALKVFFNWCIKRRYIDHDPTLGLSKHSTQSRARVLTDDELKKIWNVCSDPNSPLPKHFKTIVRLLILTGQRRSEIASLRREWVTDLEE